MGKVKKRAADQQAPDQVAGAGGCQPSGPAMPGSFGDRVEQVPVDQVVPYDRNPRVNDRAVAHVLESLRRHGQVRPLVASAPGHPFTGPVLCCGHTTLKALREFGAKTAAVQFHAFASEAEFVDYNIRDNKTTEFAEWDEAELAALSAEFALDMEGMGFDAPNVEKEKEPRPEVEFAEDLLLAHNYVVLYFDNDLDWQVAVERFGLRQVRSRDPADTCQKVGIGRVIRGAEWLPRIAPADAAQKGGDA